jgi:uncharacterized membrane protein
MTAGSRLAQVETELAEVTERLRRLEREMEVPLPEPQLPPDWGHAPRQVDREMNIENLAWSKRPEPEVCPPRTAVDFEALFGGRVLAWIGGVAILFAAVLFLGMAISRGWLDEETRTIIASAAGSGCMSAAAAPRPPRRWSRAQSPASSARSWSPPRPTR